MLEFKEVNVSYGKTHVLWDVSLNVTDSEIVALMGSNGSGKSTLVKTLSGVIRPSSGSITFLNNRLDELHTHDIAGMGIAHVPEGGQVFREMSVRENLEMGAFPMHAWHQKEETFKTVYSVFPVLKERSGQLARTLSGGEQQMLAMGRGLMSKPKLLVLDEPCYGLAPFLVKEVFRIIKTLHEQGITILLIEQNVRHTLEVADRAYVLENGRIIMQAPCCDLLRSDYIKKAYLGL